MFSSSSPAPYHQTKVKLTKISEITRSELIDESSPPAQITNVQHLSSYNWIQSTSPTIAIPGIPSLWSPPATAQRIRKDSGLIYTYHDAAHHGESPLEPLFRSLYAENPSFDISSIDLVTDRNNIRKLLTFIASNLERERRHGAFEIDIEVEPNTGTVLFCRVEAETALFIKKGVFQGYGQEFKRAYTRNEIKKSTGHHRVISYRFGGLNLLLRSEMDGYVEPDLPAQSTSAGGGYGGSDTSDKLARPPRPRPQNRAPPPYPASRDSKLLIRKQGRVVPIASTLKIITGGDNARLNKVIPRLWMSQTPNLVRAHYKDGVFEKPDVEAVSSAIALWEEENQEALKKLAVLIKKIIAVVKGNGKHFTISYEGGDALVISKVDGESAMLPDDLYSKFESSRRLHQE